MFSISCKYVVLEAVCATVAQGGGNPVVDGGFQLYYPKSARGMGKEASGTMGMLPSVSYIRTTGVV